MRQNDATFKSCNLIRRHYRFCEIHFIPPSPILFYKIEEFDKSFPNELEIQTHLKRPLFPLGGEERRLNMP